MAKLTGARPQRGTLPLTMTESQLVAAILEALSRSGLGLFWRNNTGKLPDAHGRWITYGLGLGGPDIVGMLAPAARFVGLEVKAAGGIVTPEQVAWHTAARKRGALVAIVWSVDEAMAYVRDGQLPPGHL